MSMSERKPAPKPGAAPRRRFAPVTVSVNGVEITAAAIAQEAQNHPSEDPDTAWNQAVRALAIRELLSQEAARQGIVAEPLTDDEGRRETEQEAAQRMLLEGALSLPVPDEESCLRYYRQNQARFRSPALYEAAHILFAADRRDKTAFAGAVEKARGAIAELKGQPGRFADMAKALSDCPSGQVGGSLGQIGPGDTTPAFEAALTRLEPGGMSAEPVETPYGAHVIRLDRCIEGRPVPFEAVREKIADYLAEAVWRRAAAQYVSILAGQAEITGVDLGASATPLVQ
ncbi:peptidylprolyl isomerase [Oceanibaculum indicum]|uniref:Parvulin-like PPIase n=1 Tax=Oceanibaculum indicum P24 TaxID=1207063 RepID=K2JU11_9PROT|nr:peptidylprolyl isomerase [Oceanibaculum indicum]EKE78973.1 peptidyl-prolyl cis-trans isomerase [Oceanibaculum indicum P24]